MKLLRPLFSPIVLIFLLTLAACGSSSSTASGSNTGNASAGTTPTTSAAGTILHTASATVSGKSVVLLTNSEGMTLYYFTPDTTTTTACTGGCASIWPPYISAGTNAPTSATSLPGKLAVQTTTNGHQITYNGHMLYTYSGDTSPGQTKGEGLGNKWFVATKDLAASSGQQNPTPTSVKSGSSGY